jgi:hypothetical protein
MSRSLVVPRTDALITLRAGGPDGRTEGEVFARYSRPPVTLGPPLSRLRAARATDPFCVD